MKTTVREHPYIIPRYEKFLSEEGLSLYRVIHEGVEDKTMALERHFNDVYKFFLRKLGVFEAEPYFDDEAAEKLTALLEDVIQSKKLIEEMA